jgi:zinc transporter, ZIP family
LFFAQSYPMSLSLQSLLLGLLAGSALILGSLIGYIASVPPLIIASVMAFGSGVLISTLAFDVTDEAYQGGGFDSAGFEFVSGAAVYTVINVWLMSSVPSRQWFLRFLP